MGVGAFLAVAVLALAPSVGFGTVLDRAVLSDPKFDASQETMAVNASGAAVVAWREKRDDDWIARAAVRSTAGEWADAATLSTPGGDAEDIRVAISGNGAVVVAWQRVEGPHALAQVTMRASGGPWEPARTLSDQAGDGFRTRVGVDANGNATATWTASDGRNLIVRSSSRPAGGDWTAPVDLSEPGRTAFEPQLVVMPGGAAVALWRRSDGVFSLVQSAIRPAGGVWGAAADVSSPGGNATSPLLVTTADGMAVAVWLRFNGRTWVAQGSTRTALRGWSRARDLSRDARVAALSLVAGEKIAVVEWVQSFRGLRTVVAETGSFGEVSVVDRDFQARVADNTGGIFRSSGGSAFAAAPVEYAGKGEESAVVGLLGAPCQETELEIDCPATSRPDLAVLGDARALILYRVLGEKRDVIEAVAVNSVPLPPPVSEPDPSLDDPALDDPSLEASLDGRRRARLAVGKTGLIAVPVRCGRRLACAGRITLRAEPAVRRKAGAREATRPPLVAQARFRLVAGAKWAVVMRVSPRMRALIARPRGARALLVFRASQEGGTAVVQRRVVTISG
jgi:hypothetical protein